MFDACYRCSSLPGQIIRWEMWNGASAHAIRGMKSSKARLRICLSGGKCIREVKMTECFLYLKQVFYFSTGSRGQLYSRVLPKVVVAIMARGERKREGRRNIGRSHPPPPTSCKIIVLSLPFSDSHSSYSGEGEEIAIGEKE